MAGDAGDKSLYYKNSLIDLFFRGNPNGYAPPPTVYLALYTSDPQEIGVNHLSAEVVSNGYQRQPISLTAPVDGISSNDTVITFGPCSGTDWGTIKYIGIVDAESGGILYYSDLMAVEVYIGVGNQLEFSIGSVVVVEK
jgi:hypothetical protein